MQNSNKWLGQIFSAKEAMRGGIVRRKVTSVQKYANEALLLAEVRLRGFHVVKTATQYLIFCNQGALKMLC